MVMHNVYTHNLLNLGSMFPLHTDMKTKFTVKASVYRNLIFEDQNNKNYSR